MSPRDHWADSRRTVRRSRSARRRTAGTPGCGEHVEGRENLAEFRSRSWSGATAGNRAENILGPCTIHDIAECPLGLPKICGYLDRRRGENTRKEDHHDVAGG